MRYIGHADEPKLPEIGSVFPGVALREHPFDYTTQLADTMRE